MYAYTFGKQNLIKKKEKGKKCFKRSAILVTEPGKTFLLRMLLSIRDATSGSCGMRAEQANVEIKTGDAGQSHSGQSWMT